MKLHFAITIEKVACDGLNEVALQSSCRVKVGVENVSFEACVSDII